MQSPIAAAPHLPNDMYPMRSIQHLLRPSIESAYPPPSTHEEITRWSLLRITSLRKTQNLFYKLPSLQIHKFQTLTPSKFLLPPSSCILRRKCRRTFMILAVVIQSQPDLSSSHFKRHWIPLKPWPCHSAKIPSLKQIACCVQRPLLLHLKVERFLMVAVIRSTNNIVSTRSAGQGGVIVVPILRLWLALL